MPSKPASLDELIAKRAAEFADQVRAAAAMADKEEEIRIEVEKQLAFVQKEAGVKLQGKHEFTVASGRADSVYNCVIIEYKNPSSSARIGPGANSPGAKKVVEQIKKRFYDMRPGSTLNTLFGVGCDGNHFVFVRFYNDKWQVQDPVEVNKHSVERFLWALFNLGAKGKRFEPEYLAADFGSAEGSVASAGIKLLYNAIRTTENPKAQTFFNQWKILFGEVCGYDVDNPSEKIKKLADFYGVPAKGVKPAELLFSVHTYYALFMKLLASEIMIHFHKLPGGSLVERLVNASSTAALTRVLEDLEQGGVFRHLGVTNFLEGDLFAWYLPAWTTEIEGVIRKMAARLDQYNPGTLAEEPAESRDMLKKLYQQLFPKSVRHDLGEYYTPDWLAEHVLNELGYVGDPDKRLLDPACGSGTFLVMAITRIRSWYEKNREKLKYDEGELCKKILANVVGFDLNPLAVMAARTNYLIAIRDLVSHVDKVEIPVYLCDSILTPSTYGGLFAGSTDAAKELKTSAAKFLVPTEIATSREDVAKYAEQLEFCVRNAYDPKEFIQRCQDEGLPVSAETLHIDLYKELVKLDRANKNGVWARIIKNAFAPLFIGKVDYVAGNPPWIRWSFLPEGYRQDAWPLWKELGLFGASGFMARLATAELDFSMLFLYACAKHYLDRAARLGFVITLEVFKSKTAGSGFRRFRVGDGTPMCVKLVDDMVALNPFDAANKTSVVVLQIGAATSYPVPYRVWRPKPGVWNNDLPTAVEALGTATAETQQALPSTDQVTSPWQTMAAGQKGVLSKLRGEAAYKARRGMSSDPYGVYHLEILDRRGATDVRVRNLFDRGKTEVPEREAVIESTFLYPAVRGRDVGRWRYKIETTVLCPNKSPRREDMVGEARMRRENRKTYAYLRDFRDLLLARETLWAFYGHDTDLTKCPESADDHYFRRVVKAGKKGAIVQEIEVPFYAMRDIGTYSFSPVKVVWGRMLSEIKPCVIENEEIAGKPRPVLPLDTTAYVPLEDVDEAHFVCSLLSSKLIGRAISSFSSAGRGFAAPSVLKSVNLPKYRKTNDNHRQLVKLSKECHRLVEKDSDALAECESQIDQLVASLWDISRAEMSKAFG